VAEQIVVLFRVETLVDPRHVVLDRGPNPRRQGGRSVREMLPIVKYKNTTVCLDLMQPLPNYYDINPLLELIKREAFKHHH